MEILYHRQYLCYQPQEKAEALTCCFHNSLHDSRANMSLTDVLFLLLLFVLILKAWHWQINNLSLGFEMSQQSLSSHADVSVGSDVCNSIRAQRERNLGLWPLARLCILSSLVRHDAKLQSLNTARPPAHLSAVAAVLGVHPGTRHSQVTKYVPLTYVSDCFAVFVTLFIFFLSICLYVCLSVFLSFFLLCSKEHVYD